MNWFIWILNTLHEKVWRHHMHLLKQSCRVAVGKSNAVLLTLWESSEWRQCFLKVLQNIAWELSQMAWEPFSTIVPNPISNPSPNMITVWSELSLGLAIGSSLPVLRDSLSHILPWYRQLVNQILLMDCVLKMLSEMWDDVRLSNGVAKALKAMSWSPILSSSSCRIDHSNNFSPLSEYVQRKCTPWI